MILNIARQVRDCALWKHSNARLFYGAVVNRHRNTKAGYSDRDHLLASVKWLERAHDATDDGGVSGRYSLKHGWSSSYPETTGYIIPTFLGLAKALADSRFHDRAKKCIEFLLPLQLPEGGFPGSEISLNRTVPSVFNTAQILHGLLCWHTNTGDERALESAHRAGEWLVSVQDHDGAWRRHTYENVAATYSSHASCWLAQLGRHTGEHRFLQASSQHVDWVLRHVDEETGWFDLCGFDTRQHQARYAFTHTIAYTLWGTLISSEILERTDGLDAVCRAAQAILRRMELSRWIPGILDFRWKGRATYSCLTGNAQLALLWFRLYERGQDPRYLNAALKAIDLVKVAQPMDNADSGIQGGIPGSDPVWGEYLYGAIPNWSSKYFIDAMLAKEAALEALPRRPRSKRRMPKVSPTRLTPDCTAHSAPRPRVVVYTSPNSPKLARMLLEWSGWNFRPDCVLIETLPRNAIITRLRKKIRDDGFRWILKRFSFCSGISHSPRDSSHLDADPAEVCRRRSIPFLIVGSLNSPRSLAAIRELKPDLAIDAGAGILRQPTLSIPRLGTLNAHMGILPYFRGMNVAEWAAFRGDTVGCSIHFIDTGIDTGDILAIRAIDHSNCHNIAELRAAVDKVQIQLLGEVIRSILESGQGLRGRSQTSQEGQQFFTMHSDLLAILEAELVVGP